MMSLFRTRNVVLFVVVLVIVVGMAVASGNRSLLATLENSQRISKPGETVFPTPHPSVTPFLPSDVATIEAPARNRVQDTATPVRRHDERPEDGVRKPGTIPVTVLPMLTRSPLDPIETPNATQIASQRLAGEMYYAFYEQPGTVIAEGTNTTPVKGTTLGITLTSYRITEVVLAAPVTWDVTAPSPDSGLLTSQPLTLNRLWRIEIIGEVFLGSGAWTIWIDNQAVGLGRTIERGLETVMFDDKYLREGAVLAVEYGGVRGGIREEVPERLHLLNR